jgi:hypothetical protein
MTLTIEHATETKFVNLSPLFDERATTSIRTIARSHFASLRALVACCPLQYRASFIGNDMPWNDADNVIKWAGCTFEQALDLARNGWPAGAVAATKARDSIMASMPQALRLRAYSTAGASPNVSRFLAGNPLNMRTFTRQDSTRQPTVTLLIPMCAPATVDVAKYAMQSACAAALIDMLEDRNFRCEAFAYDFSISRDRTFAAETMIRIKESSSALDINALAFAAGHPGLGRRLELAYAASAPEQRRLGEGYGRPIAIKANPATGIYTLPSIDKYDAHNKPAENFKRVALPHMRAEGCPGTMLDK